MGRQLFSRDHLIGSINIGDVWGLMITIVWLFSWEDWVNPA
jgi:hypothetical protein